MAAAARRAPARRALAGAPRKRRPAAARTAARRSPLPVPRGAALLDTLLHGRAWIGLVFVLLAGIVFFNVDLLQLNKEIATNADKAAAVARENARLRTDLARLGSSERIQRVAAERGLVLPAPGEVRYLTAAPSVDARRAAQRIDGDDATAPAAPVLAPPQPAESQPPAAQPQTAPPTPVSAPQPTLAPPAATPQPVAPQTATGTPPGPAG